MLGIAGADPAIFATVVVDREPQFAIYPGGLETDVRPYVTEPKSTAIVDYEAKLWRQRVKSFVTRESRLQRGNCRADIEQSIGIEPSP